MVEVLLMLSSFKNSIKDLHFYELIIRNIKIIFYCNTNLKIPIFISKIRNSILDNDAKIIINFFSKT